MSLPRYQGRGRGSAGGDRRKKKSPPQGAGQIRVEMEDQSAATRKRHLPVLRDVCVDLLAPALQDPGSVFVDGTLGMGGHTEAVLEALPNVTVVGIDRDPQALDLAQQRLSSFGDRFIPFHGEYDQIKEVAKLYGRGGKVDAILLDLGVSSLQLDDPSRGFSYSREADLDMRMDQSHGATAAEILSEASASELARILRDYGEERFAPRIAAAIVQARQDEPLRTTTQLSDLVKNSIPAAARRKGGNPSKRTFQALRIAVNDELTILEDTLPAALESLRLGGRLVVESYHSLEDRMVKKVFQSGLSDTAPPGLPVVPESDRPRLRALVKGAVQADEEEITQNPRSKSVRLRAVELIAPWSRR